MNNVEHKLDDGMAADRGYVYEIRVTPLLKASIWVLIVSVALALYRCASIGVF